MKPKYSKPKLIEIGLIKISPNNPRKNISDQAIKELADSISMIGLLHPIIIVRSKNNKYELIAGERRYRAVKKLKHDSINSIELLNPSIELINEIRLIENCQREDISPLEESDAFISYGKSSEEIANKIGKSIRYVSDRISLHKLIDEAKELLNANVLSITQAINLSRLQPVNQKSVLEYAIAYPLGDDTAVLVISTEQFKKECNKMGVVDLSLAKFQQSDKGLYPQAGSCLNCQKRSGANKLIFHDIPNPGLCYDPICFETKTIEHCLVLEREYHNKGYDTIRLTSLIFSSDLQNEYSIERDKNYNIRPLEKLKILEKGHKVKIGIYFETSTKLKVAEVVVILCEDTEKTASDTEKGQDIIPNPVHIQFEPKKKLEEIKIEKAKKTYKNKLLSSLGEKIGILGFSGINTQALRLIGLFAFSSLSRDLKKEFSKFYGWNNHAIALSSDGFDTILDEDGGDRVLFSHATSGLNQEDCSEIVLSCLIYSTLQVPNPNKTEVEIIHSIARSWGLNPEAMKIDAEESFQVKINEL